jgi:pyruvate ferredoxin oxidoreductase gamma subunit
MIEVRFHGRGGQGAVTSAELMAISAINEGKYAQGFPSFGPERRGAPVMAFLRIDEAPIKTREKVYAPDVIVVQDPSVSEITDVTAGLKDDGLIVFNSPLGADEIRRVHGFKQKLAVVDAGKIAREVLGVPIVNTTMLGALIKAAGLIKLESLDGPLADRFGKLASKNAAAAKAAFDQTIVEGQS